MDNRIGEMQVFLRVIETGSFSQASRQLQMTPSTVSKLIGRIEQRLNARLVERSTRRLVLTAEGLVYYERAQALVAELDDLEHTLAQGAAHARGKVRVNASVAFGSLALVPLLPEFWEVYPNIVVDLSLSDEIVDLYLDRTDIAFRIGPLQDSALVARRIGTARRKIVASPTYLEKHGTPLTLESLDEHNCLGFNFRRANPVWPFKEPERPASAMPERTGRRITERTVRGSLQANNGETVRRMALAGVGLARLGDFHVRDDIAAGRLVEVLADAGLDDEEPIHAVYLGAQRMPQRSRSFLDFFVHRLQAFLSAS